MDPFPPGRKTSTWGVFGAQCCGDCASQEGPRYKTSMIFSCSEVTPLEACQLDCPSLDSFSIVKGSCRIIFRLPGYIQKSSIDSGLDVFNQRLRSSQSIM